MKTLLLSLTLILGVLALKQSTAHAADYNVIGAGCIPIDDAIQGNDYDTGGHGVFVKGSGQANFRCPIKDPEGVWSYFYMYYGNTNTTDYAIWVKLKSSAFGGTSTTTHLSCTSNTVTGTGSKYCNFTDFTPSTTRHYWFDVTIYRAAGQTKNPEFLGVALW